MCTVTFIPAGNRIFLTANRDERLSRKKALPPLLYWLRGGTLLYPKDGDKGGTWIAVSKKGNAGVLLNGALQPHQSAPPYRQSRGLILPHLLTLSNPVDAFAVYDTNGIEPFTLLLYVRRRLFECRWDGKQKSINQMPADKPHIWSSATLYTPAGQEQKMELFHHWLKDQPAPNADTINRLHSCKNKHTNSAGFLLDGNNETLTVSITSIELDNAGARIHYYSVPDNARYRNSFRFSFLTTVNIRLWWRRFKVRLKHWEYWPFHVVYAPIYPYWFWLCLKARSFFFFSAANPTIRNGGFLMESKKEIYDLLPAGSYPKTALVKKQNTIGDWAAFLYGQGLQFPLIAKPDIGLRGIGVALLRSVADLQRYHQQSKVDYLLQAYVPYENEVGIFYYRFPGHQKGTITGVVGKEFLKVIGDGQSTIDELLQRDNRYLLQLAALRKNDPLLLTQILFPGEECLIVPYGNHSRGAKFIDLTHLENDALANTINTLCRQIAGFYFGRLDIRYQSWEELCAGKNYSVIELNGAGSEPAHIYDPKHSLVFAWKEIIRHLKLLYRISKCNKKVKKATYLTVKQGVDLFRQNAAYIKKIS